MTDEKALEIEAYAEELNAATESFLRMCQGMTVWSYPAAIDMFSKDISRIQNHYFREVGELRERASRA